MEAATAAEVGVGMGVGGGGKGCVHSASWVLAREGSEVGCRRRRDLFCPRGTHGWGWQGADLSPLFAPAFPPRLPIDYYCAPALRVVVDRYSEALARVDCGGLTIARWSTHGGAAVAAGRRRCVHSRKPPHVS